MNGDLRIVDAQRERWHSYRASLGLDGAAVENFGAGGMASQLQNLSVRMMFLTGDPLKHVVSLEKETLEWLKQTHHVPYAGGGLRWDNERATSSAVLLFNSHRDDGSWDRYIALHRHGGVEIAYANLTFQKDETRIVPLRHIVGLSWILLGLQVEVIKRWNLPGPYEFSLAIPDVKDAVLGGLAEGWAQPGSHFYHGPCCIEENLLLRFEIDAPPEPEELAMEVGDQLENGFGGVQRRHLGLRAPYEGIFDPRFAF